MSSLVFPALPGLDIAVRRQPIYKTRVQEAYSGKELRVSAWSYPRYRYTLDLNFLRASAVLQEFQILFGFIARHAGSFDSFLFRDPEDNVVDTMPFGMGNGSRTQFQLQRTLVPSAALGTPASRAYWPAIGDGYEPLFEMNGSPSIYLNGALQSSYSLTNGLVTFPSAPPAQVLTWTGGFYRRVRFAGDEHEAERIVAQIWEAKSIELISVK